MIVPYDKEYQATKLIMQGKSSLDQDFKGLANFIDVEFGVKTINIIFDLAGIAKNPTINICLEFEHELNKFYKNDKIDFNKKKQALIANKFRELIKEGDLFKNHEFLNNPELNLDSLWVYFSAFEPIAKIEANEKIPQGEVIQLQKELGDENLWEISRCFFAATFFLYTDEQVKIYEDSNTRRIWTDKYFELLTSYDEFKYFKYEDFKIYLDSKENFDNNFKSNWYYYYK